MRVRMHLLLLGLIGVVLGLAPPARGQWVLDSEAAAIGGATSCASGNSIVRSFDVGTAGTVADLDLGLDANHSWRGDIQAQLTSPQGTTVTVLQPDTGNNGRWNDYRIRLDDGAAVAVNTGTHAADTPAGTGRYADRVRPSNPLAAFNGEAANGTWTLEMCDAFPTADNGTYLRSTLFITPVAPPQAPPLVCAAGQSVPFDWGAPGTPTGWTAGTLTGGYTAGTAPTAIPFAIAVTGDTGNLIARNGVQTPVTSSELSGGTDRAVIFNADFSNRAQSILVTLNLGTPGIGVSGVQFVLQDVDRDGWNDRVLVDGTLSGASVTPSLTPGLTNRVSGQTVDGTALAASGTPEAEAVVTFNAPVDQVTLSYTNAPGTPADPASQIMGFFADLALCPVLAADLTAVKSVVLPGPAPGDLYMTPGQDILYKITVEHAPGSNADASDVMISDTLPATLQYVSSAFTGFTAGGFANQNCPTEPCVVNFENGVLPPGTTGEIVITATIR